MTYILESKSEAERLSKQNAQPQYYIPIELQHLKLDLNGKKILDAGCGVGTLAKVLSENYYAVVHACDAAETRVQQAKKTCSPGVHFFTGDLTSLATPDDFYDVIFVRFVLEHTRDPQPILKELRRVLKPNGRLVIIDFDGLIFNLHHKNELLGSYLSKLEKDLPIDLFIGRKLPRMLSEMALTVDEFYIQPLIFQHDDLEAEAENMLMRFQQTESLIKSILGSEHYGTFVDLYLSELRKSQGLFCNKFIITALKPAGV